jgi:hypothetical protein
MGMIMNIINEYNNLLARRYVNESDFYKFISESKTEEEIAHIFACIKILSRSFQDMVAARFLFHRDSALKKIAQGHLLEEVGHDDYFNEYVLPQINDPILEAYAAYFVNKMIFENDLNSSVITHLVIEKAADMTLPRLLKLVVDSLGPDNCYVKYASDHSELDGDHSSMLDEFLDKIDHSKVDQVKSLLEDSWQVFACFFDRVYNLSKTAETV